MIQIDFLDLCVLLICSAAFLAFRFLPAKTALLKKIPALRELERGFQRAAEEGKRLHFSLGRGGVLFQEGAAGLAALAALKFGVRAGTSGDCSLAVTCGAGAPALMSAAALEAQFPPEAESTARGSQFPLTGFTPASYALGALDALNDPQTCGNVLLGSTGAECTLLAEGAERRGALTLAGSGDLEGQASLTVWSDDVLYGDLFYAIPGAMKTPGARDDGDVVSLPADYRASLGAQDVLRWALILAALGGALTRIILP